MLVFFVFLTGDPSAQIGGDQPNRTSDRPTDRPTDSVSVYWERDTAGLTSARLVCECVRVCVYVCVGHVVDEACLLVLVCVCSNVFLCQVYATARLITTYSTDIHTHTHTNALRPHQVIVLEVAPRGMQIAFCYNRRLCADAI